MTIKETLQARIRGVDAMGRALNPSEDADYRSAPRGFTQEGCKGESARLYGLLLKNQEFPLDDPGIGMLPAHLI